MTHSLPRVILHASCVVVAGRGLLICGRSGSGKSGLALQLMGYGAGLIADDRVELWVQADHARREAQVMAGAPDGLPALIEARHVGLLRADLQPPVPLCAVADMDRVETERLPVQMHTTVLDHEFALFHRVDSPHFAAALMQYLKAGALDADV